MYEKINELLKERNITKKQMCTELNIPYNSLMSMFNRQSKNIALSTIQDIADYLNITIDYLIRDEISNPNYGFIQDRIDGFDIGKADMIEFSDALDEPRQVPKEEAAEIYMQILSMPPEMFGDMKLIVEFLQWKHKYNK